jgi:hypothetical protein
MRTGHAAARLGASVAAFLLARKLLLLAPEILLRAPHMARIIKLGAVAGDGKIIQSDI